MGARGSRLRRRHDPVVFDAIGAPACTFSRPDDLYRAVCRVDARAARRAIAAGWDAADAQALHVAAGTRDYALTTELVAAGADVEEHNCRHGPTGGTTCEMTPLCVAAIDNSEPMVQLLLSLGADPLFACSGSGTTPLHYAHR